MNRKDKPKRADGKAWTTAQDLAAQFRAQEYTWPEVADKIEKSKNTIQQYPGRYENFDDLIDWYRFQYFEQRIQQLLTNLWPEALEALNEVIADIDQVGTEHGPDYSDVISASRTILRNTGFRDLQKRRHEIQAEQEMTGSAGEEHTIKVEELDDENPEEELRHLADILEESDEEPQETELIEADGDKS